MHIQIVREVSRKKQEKENPALFYWVFNLAWHPDDYAVINS